MSRDDSQDPPPNADLEALVGDAFAASGELLPTTEGEVRRAEAEIDQQPELPLELSEWRPRDEAPRPPVSLAEARRARAGRWLSHGLAAAVGAAAATAIFALQPDRHEGAAPPASSEPLRADAQPLPTVAPPIRLPPPARCGECCAGKACDAAKDELRECSSGRLCVTCKAQTLWESRYRVRLGRLAPTDQGRKLIDRGGADGVEMCVRTGSSQLACTPPNAGTAAEDQWARLPLVTSAQDLVAGVELILRQRGTSQVLGEWKSPVPLTSTLLCKGLFVKPKSKSDDVLGVVSIFFDDTHFVELGRAGTAPPLLALERRIEGRDWTAKLFETSASGDRRFALGIGPLDKGSAEKLRWALLEAGVEARTTLGDDYERDPLVPK